MNPAQPINIVWFKRDLRCQDHAPLAAASQASGLTLPLYIFEPEYWLLPDTSTRHWHFIYDCLLDLDLSLQHLGGRLFFMKGDIVEMMASIRARGYTITIWSHQETGNAWTYARDLRLKSWTLKNNITWHQFPTHAIVRGLKVSDDWHVIRKERLAQPVVVAPFRLSVPTELEGAELISKNPAPFKNLIVGKVQKGGRLAANRLLNEFINTRCEYYLQSISKPEAASWHCSRLSPHITYGTLSVREILQAILQVCIKLSQIPSERNKRKLFNLNGFITRLVWHCHFIQKLESEPSIELYSPHPAFENMREPYFREDFLNAWCQGKTGYPFIDACMRALISTGWINFRMRAMLVSFASYDLWLDWRRTAPYLATLFTDYEPGIHYPQFHMQSGITGINTIRIYNPIKQSYEQDPQGSFIKKYVPELRHVTAEWIHEPWTMATPPNDYPAPIVEHEIVIRWAKQQLAEKRKEAGFKVAAKKNINKLSQRAKKKKALLQNNSRQIELDL